VLARPGREERQEVADRHLEEDRGGDLAVAQTA
jgi:hypothetical protein